MIEALEPDDYVTCISRATREALLEHVPHLRPERIHVTPLAAGAHFYPESDLQKRDDARARYGIPAGVPYLLSVCTLEPRKNLETVIRAFVQLLSDRRVPRDLHLVLVGHLGWKTAGIARALKDAGPARDSIVLTGFVQDNDLAAIYSGATAFAYMSWAEGFGLPPLEAMQCGVPVITSDCSSLPEVVGDAGLLTDPSDLEQLAHHISSLVNDQQLRQQLSRKAVARAKNFSWPAFISKTVAAYRSALGLLPNDSPSAEDNSEARNPQHQNDRPNPCRV